MAHAAGNLPLQLHDWGVDFAVWCSYKYLNGGPGCVARMLRARAPRAESGSAAIRGLVGKRQGQRASGWRRQFQAIPGAEGWQLSNPSILSMAALRASMDIFDEAGIERLRAKSEILTAYLGFLLEQHDERKLLNHYAARSGATRRAAIVAD